MERRVAVSSKAREPREQGHSSHSSLPARDGGERSDLKHPRPELNNVPSLNIPSADGPLTVDGRVEEDVWEKAVVLPLQSREFGPPFPAGGEMRTMVRRGYLCLSARLPESRRIVARSIGRDPVWWREDLVIWTFRFHNSEGHDTPLTLSVNPLGAYRVDPPGTSGDPQQGVRASASLGSESWDAEAAIPVARLAKIGFVSVERIRVPRPDAPELRWYWGGVTNPLDRTSGMDFELLLGGFQSPASIR